MLEMMMNQPGMSERFLEEGTLTQSASQEVCKELILERNKANEPL